jgi:hypothetical protein
VSAPAEERILVARVGAGSAELSDSRLGTYLLLWVLVFGAKQHRSTAVERVDASKLLDQSWT